jgi:hypothetical protein
MPKKRPETKNGGPAEGPPPILRMPSHADHRRGIDVMPISDTALSGNAPRRRLPNRRPCETFTFAHNGADFTASIGRYPDGAIGEIFIAAGHANSALDALASDAAIAVSFALQHGADLDVMRAAMKRNPRGEPTSPIGAALDLVGTATAGRAVQS